MFNNLKKLLGLDNEAIPRGGVPQPRQQGALQQPLNVPRPAPAAPQIPNNIRRPANPNKNYLGSNGDIQLAPRNWRTPPREIPKYLSPSMQEIKYEDGTSEIIDPNSFYARPVDDDQIWSRV